MRSTSRSANCTRLGQLPWDREIHVIGRLGQPACYYATRLLRHNGFKVRNPAGGPPSRVIQEPEGERIENVLVWTRADAADIGTMA
jgi:hypothetical protein